MSTALHDRLLLIRHATAMASAECLRGNTGFYSPITMNNQTNPTVISAGGRSPLTLRTAGTNPAPCTARAVLSSRHRAPRRRAVIGLKDEGRFSMRALQRTFVQGSTSSALRRSRNQMSAVPYTQRNTEIGSEGWTGKTWFPPKRGKSKNALADYLDNKVRGGVLQYRRANQEKGGAL